MWPLILATGDQCLVAGAGDEQMKSWGARVDAATPQVFGDAPAPG